MIDALIVGAVVASAVGYLVWRALPRRRAAACAGCPAKR
jgi:hypothetical protein